MGSKSEPDVPTPIDQIHPVILASWDKWIRRRKDKSKEYTTTSPKGVTPRVRDRPVSLEIYPNASRSEMLLREKRGNY